MSHGFTFKPARLGTCEHMPSTRHDRECGADARWEFNVKGMMGAPLTYQACAKHRDDLAEAVWGIGGDPA